jgi:hypothetical protein
LAEALSRRCYTMSGPHLSGWRLIIGFNTLEEAQAAHTAVAEAKPAAPELLEALKRNRAALDLIDPMRPLQYATTMDLMRKDMDAAIATAEGRTNG